MRLYGYDSLTACLFVSQILMKFYGRLGNDGLHLGQYKNTQNSEKMDQLHLLEMVLFI